MVTSSRRSPPWDLYAFPFWPFFVTLSSPKGVPPSPPSHSSASRFANFFSFTTSHLVSRSKRSPLFPRIPLLFFGTPGPSTGRLLFPCSRVTGGRGNVFLFHLLEARFSVGLAGFNSLSLFCFLRSPSSWPASPRHLTPNSSAV